MNSKFYYFLNFKSLLFFFFFLHPSKSIFLLDLHLKSHKILHHHQIQIQIQIILVLNKKIQKKISKRQLKQVEDLINVDQQQQQQELHDQKHLERISIKENRELEVKILKVLSMCL